MARDPGLAIDTNISLLPKSHRPANVYILCYGLRPPVCFLQEVASSVYGGVFSERWHNCDELADSRSRRPPRASKLPNWEALISHRRYVQVANDLERRCSGGCVLHTISYEFLNLLGKWRSWVLQTWQSR